MNIRTLCLGILQFGEATGYEINKLVADGRFSHFIEASYGSIYPALTKMMEEELVTCREEIQEGKPSRKVYAITSSGQQQLFHALTDSPQPNRFKSEFLFVSLFANHLPAPFIENILENHERQLSDKVNYLREAYECCDHECTRFSVGYGIAANEAMLKYIQDNKHLLASLSQSETDPPETDTMKISAGETL